MTEFSSVRSSSTPTLTAAALSSRSFGLSTPISNEAATLAAISNSIVSHQSLDRVDVVHLKDVCKFSNGGLSWQGDRGARCAIFYNDAWRSARSARSA